VGDVFSKEKIMTGLNNLANLRFFETFVPETPQGSAQGLMDLVINVEEGRTTDINFGVTFTMEAGQFPLLGFITWTDRNLMGTGRQLSIGSEVSGTQQNLNFSFKDDWLFGRRWSGGVDFSIKHRLIEGALQDVMAPVFFGTNDENPQMVPDPFSGEWVNPDTGEPATAEEIAAGTAVTDYSYAISNGQSIDDSYLMDYETYEFSLGGSTGYSWHTNLGRIGTGTGMSTALSYTTYDDEIYRPYNPDIRNELGLWSFINKWWGRISFDTRDIVYSPNKGVFLSQSLSYTGGVLGGSRHYNKLTTIGEVFFKLLEVPVTDAWNFKTVLALHSNLSLVLPQWHFDSNGDWVKDTVATTSDLLYTDGMITAKGWPVQQDGKVLWDNWAELRMPIIAGYISFNHFFSATALYDDTSEMKDLGFDDFRYGFGSGLQIDLPTFPMGFYFVKRFSVVDDQIQWQPGNAFRQADDPTSGLDFVISFSFSYF
jgi:outer membrane protein insertion porin family